MFHIDDLTVRRLLQKIILCLSVLYISHKRPNIQHIFWFIICSLNDLYDLCYSISTPNLPSSMGKNEFKGSVLYIFATMLGKVFAAKNREIQ